MSIKKGVKKFGLLLSVLGSMTLLPAACNANGMEEPPVVMQYDYVSVDLQSANQLDVRGNGANQYHITTTGEDPYLYSAPLRSSVNDKMVLTFDYKMQSPLSHIQFFLASPIEEDRSFKSDTMKTASTWATYSIDLGDQMSDFAWGVAGDFLRIDFGDEASVELEIRNIRFRKRNEKEEQLAHEREAFRLNDQQWNARIAEYLRKDYPDNITSVDVTADRIRVAGALADAGRARLVEIKPYDELTEMSDFGNGVGIAGGSFVVELDRYVEQDGFHYDRALSKWVIADTEQAGAGVRSHARFPDRIQAKQALPRQELTGRKGLGGYAYSRGFITDLDDLSISSVTVNIAVTSLMYLDERPNSYVHEYGGRKYYFDQDKITDLDRTFRTAADKGIVVSAIILIQKASETADPKVGELLEHPQLSGREVFYSMPRLDQPKSVNAYAAMIDFLANRYSRPDNLYGRIHKWIMHNEVDLASVWTNMGAGRPMYVYLDAYHKSMRMCYTIARNYDANAEVLGSFAHSWTESDIGGDYAALEMIEGLLAYSRAEGDFQWGLAYHPYPEDINEPKTWNDRRATFSMNTPLVTFKNLEVLDAWIKKPEHMYRQSIKRTLWLSENGTNSRSYNEQDLLEQAAGFTYAWKQFKHLDGIDAMQWHNWIDGRSEFGLRIGLRRFPDDEQDPGGKKPVWYAYQAAGTDKEDEVFEPYKVIIGITSWDEVLKGLGLQ